jgi:hypothetical protein
MAQMMQHFLCKHEGLSSNSILTKNKKKLDMMAFDFYPCHTGSIKDLGARPAQVVQDLPSK